jgi:deazaflavin-dependent oxidoreductase (nitroreductase family)
MNDFNAKIIEEFRANAGKVGGQFEGAPLLLLHTTGAKSGKERVNPVMYRTEGEDLVVFGSKGGMPTHPDWYHNLVSNPRATVEVGTETFEVEARVTEGEERQRIWSAHKQEWPPFADYEARTGRQIPVVVLQRVS